MSSPITIALAQIDITLADRERNLARIIQVLGETAAKGAKLTVFPEAALTGYCYDTLDEARPQAAGQEEQDRHDRHSDPLTTSGKTTPFRARTWP